MTVTVTVTTTATATTPLSMSTLTLTSTMNEELNPPEEYICPISLSVMKDPVMSKDGKNFEKRAILDWLTRGNVNCPLTRQPLKPSLLVPNASLKLSIDQWKKENGIEDTEDDENSTSSDIDCPFVGLLQLPVDANLPVNNNDNILPSIARRDAGSTVDDDLSDLLDLYNEVLELTAGSFHSMPMSMSSSPLSSSSSPQERRSRDPVPDLPPVEDATEAALSVIVAHTSKRMWRPKLFKKQMNIT